MECSAEVVLACVRAIHKIFCFYLEHNELQNISSNKPTGRFLLVVVARLLFVVVVDTNCSSGGFAYAFNFFAIYDRVRLFIDK